MCGMSECCAVSASEAYCLMRTACSWAVYGAVPAMGAVIHTLNLRLSPQDLAYIANHAEDKAVVVDESLLPLLRQFLQDVPSIKHVIVIRDGAGKTLPSEGIIDYEQLLYAVKAEEQSEGEKIKSRSVV